jgi:hypothetical protein
MYINSAVGKCQELEEGDCCWLRLLLRRCDSCLLGALFSFALRPLLPNKITFTIHHLSPSPTYHRREVIEQEEVKDSEPSAYPSQQRS